jgi:hypothetical protein
LVVPSPTATAYRARAQQAEKAIEGLEAERDRLDQLIYEWHAEHDKMKAKEAGADLKRSTMTAKEKSEYIRAHGKDNYLALRWD